MGLVSFAPINDGDEANDDLFNSRLGAITDELNGNIDQDNLATSAVSTAKIADSAVTTSKLNNSAVTTPKFKPTIINSNFTPQGVRFATTNGAMTVVPGCSMTYTSGSTPEILFLIVQIMAYNSASSGEAALHVNNVRQNPAIYIDAQSPWVRAGQTYFVEVAASTTITLDIRVYAAGGSTTQVTNETVNWMPTIRGIAIGNS